MEGRRFDPERRCPECRLQRRLCICALIPRLETRTRLVLVLHQLEARKPTNTGLLAVRCLANSTVVMRGRRPDGPDALPDPLLDDDFPWLEAPEDAVLLFPSEDAVPIAEVRDHPRPLRLVVPDGTWSQAIRARKRLHGLDRLRCVYVPAGASEYRLRHDPREGHLSTLEAIARAYGALEGAAAQEALERVHRIMVERTLWSRGRLAVGEVTGGIPDETS
jgi:DTW domain-containing protein YfiP